MNACTKWPEQERYWEMRRTCCHRPFGLEKQKILKKDGLWEISRFIFLSCISWGSRLFFVTVLIWPLTSPLLPFILGALVCLQTPTTVRQSSGREEERQRIHGRKKKRDAEARTDESTINRTSSELFGMTSIHQKMRRLLSNHGNAAMKSPILLRLAMRRASPHLYLTLQSYLESAEPWTRLRCAAGPPPWWPLVPEIKGRSVFDVQRPFCVG